MICIKFEGEFTIIKELASDLKKKGLLETCLRLPVRSTQTGATHRQAKIAKVMIEPKDAQKEEGRYILSVSNRRSSYENRIEQI